MVERNKREVRYRVWFENEPEARSRYFTNRADASEWASANQPNRPFELAKEQRGVVRRLWGILRGT